MLRIRLSRRGAKKKPFYRVVVAEKSSARDGRFLEILGHYDPCKDPALIDLKMDRVNHWIQSGAQPSDTVRTLISRAKQAEAKEQAQT
ncbi:MAG TPA: 30S ribosomal protein S16 [Acidobacteriota bacterium]|nr:30S ribosomal protein S16 [Acidobacteriota bacterium]